jgi:peptidoglycan pentaglycine glycine transferase (the first glycine)
MIEIQRCDDAEQWDEYILEHNGHPLQLWSWGQVKAGHGWAAVRYFVYDNDHEGNIVGAAQVLIRKLPLPFRSFGYIPRGPVVDDEYRNEFLKGLAVLVKQEYGSVALSVEPNAFEFTPPTGWKRSNNKILSADTILLDVSRSESDLLADMAKKTRQYIRKSAAEGVEIRQIRTKDELRECLEIYHQTAERAGFNLHKDQYYFDVFNLMKDHSPVFGAYVDGKIVSFLWMAISAETAYELYGGMNETGQQIRANYALKWHVIRKVKEWGLRQYDFGGLVVGGVSLFKQGWSSTATSFAGTYDVALSPFYALWSKGLPKAKAILQKIRR